MVFVGEVLLVVFDMAMTPRVADAVRGGPALRLDLVGTALSALGLGALVLAVLESSTWGWVVPKDSPIEPSRSP